MLHLGEVATVVARRCDRCCIATHRASRSVSLGNWRASVTRCVEQENVSPLISVTDSRGNYDHLHNGTVGPSEDRRGAIDLAIIREDLSRPQMFLRWVDGKAQVADAMTW